MPRPTPERPRKPRLSIERILLVLIVAGSAMKPGRMAYDASLVGQFSEPRHTWQLIDGKNWQIAAQETEPQATTDAVEGTRGGCPAGMVDVEGHAKVDAPGAESIEAMQNQVCTTWLQREFPERCASFDAARWRVLSERLPTRPLHFCIDRFEYPNTKAAYPVIMVTWREASALCAAESKRLCTETEWTFACEGEDATPYPDGYERDAAACVIDRPWRTYLALPLGWRSSELAMREIDELWQGEPSGASPRCRSSFGVYDMTGNVDEWTISDQAEGFRSIMKGGYWGPVRARCRPSTRVHNEDFYFYQQGFRCCADASDGDAGPTAIRAGHIDSGVATPVGPPMLSANQSSDEVSPPTPTAGPLAHDVGLPSASQGVFASESGATAAKPGLSASEAGLPAGNTGEKP
ncbi:MAG: SUMF1/EgtB/PvdO family nonheme iron enzyme [Polyangiaceae bacterium]